VTPVLVEGLDAAVEFRPLCGSEGKLVGIEAVLKRAEQSRTLR
jgi:hypothetical protein